MTESVATPAKLWTVNFTLAWMANFLMGFSFFLLMPTLPYFLAEEFHANQSMIGVVASCYIIAALAMRPFSGYVVDRFPRKTVYMLSFLFFVLFNFGYLVAGSLLFIAVLRFLHGLTWGVITTSGATLAIDLAPSEKRGQGIGYYGLAINISMAVGPMAGILIYQHYDFTTLFYAAIVTGIAGMLFAQMIKVPAKPKVPKHSLLSLDRFILVKAIPVGINLMLITISYGMILSFAAMYSTEMHADNPGLFYILVAGGIALARAISGKMVDNGHLNRASIIGITILSVGFAVFSLLKTPEIYYSMALFIGIGYGTVYPAIQTIFINMADHHQRGTANSTYLTAYDAGVGIGMLVAGKIAESASLGAAFGFSAIACTAAIFYYIKISMGSYRKYKLATERI